MLSPASDISEYIKRIFNSLLSLFLDKDNGRIYVEKSISLLDKIIQENGGMSGSQTYSFFASFLSSQHQVALTAHNLKLSITDVCKSEWDLQCAFTIVQEFIKVAEGSWRKEKFAYKFFIALCESILDEKIVADIFAKKNEEGVYISAALFTVTANELLSQHVPSITPPQSTSPEEAYLGVYEDSGGLPRSSSLESLEVVHEPTYSNNMGHNAEEGGLLHTLPSEEGFAPPWLPAFSQAVPKSPTLINPFAAIALVQLGSEDARELTGGCCTRKQLKW